MIYIHNDILCNPVSGSPDPAATAQQLSFGLFFILRLTAQLTVLPQLLKLGQSEVQLNLQYTVLGALVFTRLVCRMSAVDKVHC